MIYLDCAASTPMFIDSIKAVQKAMLQDFTNPSSPHKISQLSLNKIEAVKKQILTELNAPEGYDLIFTSSATESNNQAIASIPEGHHIYFSMADHPSIIAPIQALEKRERMPLDINSKGQIQWTTLNTQQSYLAISYVNSLTGQLFNLAEFTRTQPEINVHLDATQAFGKFKINLQETPLASLTLSAHKMGGPKGIAALVFNKSFPIKPLLLGGGHQQGLRSATLSTPLIVGWGEAIKIACEQTNREYEKIISLKLHMQKSLKAKLGDDVQFLFENTPTSPYITLFALKNIPSEVMMRFLSEDDIMISSASACSTKQKENPTLKALQVDAKWRNNVLRASFCHKTSAFEIDSLCEKINQHYNILKKLHR